MKFMIFFNHVEGVWDSLDEATRQGHQQALGKLMADLAEQKQSRLVFFAPADGARTVRQHADGRQELIAGPARPGPEQIGGYYLIDADSIEEAVEWARRGRFLTGSNEVRQIVECGG